MQKSENYTEDKKYLAQTLTLAKKGNGWTFPNPMVGAIIVKNGKIIGKGFHKKAGLPHAEIEALQHVTENVREATLYVNLEPCSHSGKTPPCVDAIIASGITRVVCCTVDPNPQVKVQGIKKLHDAGIHVTVGLLEKEALQLNEAFFTFHEKQRPFIAIKFAASLDGKIATRTGDSKWITNEKARLFARKLRSEYQAILVGIHTVMKDNPHLGTRIHGKKDPMRIILDSTLQLPLESNVLRDTNVLIVTTEKVDKGKLAFLQKKNIPYVIARSEERATKPRTDFWYRAKQSRKDKENVNSDHNGIASLLGNLGVRNDVVGTRYRISIPNLLQELYKRNILSILVEGGAHILGSFVDEKLVDKVYAFHAPILIGGEKALSAVAGKGAECIIDAVKLQKVSFKKFDDNIVTIGYPH